MPPFRIVLLHPNQGSFWVIRPWKFYLTILFQISVTKLLVMKSICRNILCPWTGWCASKQGVQCNGMINYFLVFNGWNMEIIVDWFPVIVGGNSTRNMLHCLYQYHQYISDYVAGFEIIQCTHSNCCGALCFCYGALCKVPVQIHICLMKVPLERGSMPDIV